MILRTLSDSRPAVFVIGSNGDVTRADLDADEMLHGLETMLDGTVPAVRIDGTIVEERRM